jgi:polyhydroxyalkanoate synthesis regulator phasin
MAISRRRKLAAGVAGAVVLAGSGGAYAATQKGTSTRPPDPAAEQQAFLNDLAGRLHVTPDQLDAAIKGAASDQIDAAVKAGRLSQDQANQLKQRIQQAPDGVPLRGLFGPGPHPGFGRGGPGPLGDLGAAARYLGVTDRQLFSDLRAGKSLADVAKAQNESVDGLKAALKAAETARLDEAVKAGRLTTDQRAKIEAGLDQRLDEEINGTPPAGPGRMHGPRFRWP